MENFVMRAACKHCAAPEGYIITKQGQDCVYCAKCNRHQYNAPKTETGRAVRSVKTTHDAISSEQRSRIIERANRRCERCGKSIDSCVLHVGHILSVKQGHEHGLSDDVINSDENLIAECDECNLGHGKGVLPVRLLIALLCARESGNV